MTLTTNQKIEVIVISTVIITLVVTAYRNYNLHLILPLEEK